MDLELGLEHLGVKNGAQLHGLGDVSLQLHLSLHEGLKNLMLMELTTSFKLIWEPRYKVWKFQARECARGSHPLVVCVSRSPTLYRLKLQTIISRCSVQQKSSNFEVVI